MIFRLRDILLSVVGLVLLSPVYLVLSLLIWSRMGRPIFFRHERAGYQGWPFMLVKFRTMTDARDPAGNLLPDRERLTTLGRFLRASSLDELPELAHVLTGKMSLVGPRPLPTKYLPRYTAAQRRRHEVLPGITGWAQVNGRNALSWDEKFALDVWYVDHRTLGLDWKILWQTVWITLRREGINQPGQATMEEFWGTARREAGEQA